MIKNIRLLRNIGQFEHVDAGKNIDLTKLTLCFAENGRGKTTLTAIMRSLAQNDPAPIVERIRFGASDLPHVVITGDDVVGQIVFKDSSWSGPTPQIVVFDDRFVEENVYSGLTVSSQQRQHLHDLILGPEAVRLQKCLDEQIDKIEHHNRELRSLESAVRPHLPEGFAMERFCLLKPDSKVDEHITEVEAKLSAARAQEKLIKTPGFRLTELPTYDLQATNELLASTLVTLEQDAVTRIQEHLKAMPKDGEDWLANGMRYVSERGDAKSYCPFCGSSLEASLLIDHYRAYFSEGYSSLKQKISVLHLELQRRFGPELRANFEQELRVAIERHQFWEEFITITPITIETDSTFEACTVALHAILQVVEAKRSAPLERMTVPTEAHQAVEEYAKHARVVIELKERLAEANRQIDELKARVESLNIEELANQSKLLKATKIRYEGTVSNLCDAYLKEIALKSATENTRDEIRRQLNKHRTEVFPAYENAVNQCLEKFGTGFRLADLRPRNLRVGSTTTYGAQVRATSIDVGSSSNSPEPSFGSVLSAGDRTTLAFAFFFASLDRIAEPEETIVVIDDPISSMDSGRALSSAQEIRNLTSRFGQVIVLSHDRTFLCAIANHADQKTVTPIEIVRIAEGSDIATWDLQAESQSEHDVRFQAFQMYLGEGLGNRRNIAQSIRLHLEGYLRVVCPQYMPAGRPLGRQFLSECFERLNSDDEILSSSRLNEVKGLLEFSSKYHHDTNSAWESETIVDAELQSYVRRVLRFTGPSG